MLTYEKQRRIPYLICIFTFSINLLTCFGITLPPFRQLAHELQSGPIEIINSTTIYINEFYYDGKGPDAHFWVGKGAPSPNGTAIPDENGSAKSLSMYTGQNITIHLPSNTTVADIDYLAVWCIAHKHNFGHVFMNERLIHTNKSKLFLPHQLKPFNSTNITSYSIVIEDEQKIVISIIHYNKSGENIHFRVGSGSPSSDDKIVPNEYGSVQNLPNYNGENISLKLPENVSLSNIDYLTIWDNDRKKELATVYLDETLSKEQDTNILGFQLSNFNYTDGHCTLYSGPILIINERTFYISNFNQKCNWVQFRISFENATTVQVPDETNSYDWLNTYQGNSFYLELPETISIARIKRFGIWSDEQRNYSTYVEMGSISNIPPYNPHSDVTEDGRRIVRVPKCCPHGHVVTKNGCTRHEEIGFDVEMKLHLANETHLNDDPMIKEWIVFAPYVHNILCPKYYLTPEMDNYSLLVTGKLLYVSIKEQLSLDRYCLDTLYEEGDSEEEGILLHTAFVCADGDSGPKTMHVVFAICAIFSAISLFVTASLYYIIRKQDDKRGFSISGYASSMGVAFTCLAITQIAGLETVCNVLGGIFHFFIVQSFAWYVAIAFEAYYHVKFFDSDSILLGYIKRRNTYVILSFAIPLLFVVMSYILKLPAGLLNTHLDEVCFFQNAKWMLYVPIIVGITTAGVLAVLSVLQFRDNNNIPKDETTKRFVWSRQKRDVQGRIRFSLFLVSLTSVCWLSEIITYAIQFPVFLLDVIHALQGVIVLTTVLSTGGIFKKVVTFFNSCRTGRATPEEASLPMNGGGNNSFELTRLNHTNN